MLGQNVNSYRDDANGSAVSFAELLYRISTLSPDLRIRYSTSHPKDCSDELLHVHRERDNVCNFIHLPVQHGNTAMLERMRRTYSRSEYLDLVDRARSIVPRRIPVYRYHCRFLRRDRRRTRGHALADARSTLRPRFYVHVLRAPGERTHSGNSSITFRLKPRRLALRRSSRSRTKSHSRRTERMSAVAFGFWSKAPANAAVRRKSNCADEQTATKWLSSTNRVVARCRQVNTPTSR